MSTLAEVVLAYDRAHPGPADAIVEVHGPTWAKWIGLARGEIAGVERYALGVVACSAEKAPSPAPARELYRGQLFRLSLELAERLSERVIILSAKHGVVLPDEVIEPYEWPLAERTPAERVAWGRRVSREIYLCAPAEEVLMLAAESYHRHVLHLPGRSWITPLLGMGIGKQKAWLKKRLEEENR